MRKFTKIIMMSLALFMTQAIIFGQTTTGRLVGTVAEANGAVIPGATVVVTDTKTGKELTGATNSEGSFNFPLLDFGTYTVKVTAKGFKTTTTTIKIEVGQEYSLPLSLEVGDVSENVTVTAGADIVNSTNAELSSTISNRQITELPLAARNPLSLILTQAGSASSPNQNTSINGGRTSSTNVTRDGINQQDNFIRSNATDFSPGRPSVDNVEEFTLTSQSSVDSGFGSAQVNFVTPRGGNEFHGAVWEYNRNAKLSANSFFNNAGGNYGPNEAIVLAGVRKAGEARVPRPPRNRNQYGFKVSGPIFKNKLFFFAFGERLKDIVNTNKVITVLTPAARAGNFTYTSGGTTYTRNLFAAGVWNAGASSPAPSAINTLIQSRYLANMPLGNSFEVGDGLNTTGYRFFQKANQDRDALTGRVDYDLNAQNNISVVVDYNYEKNLRTDLGGTTLVPDVLQPARNVTTSAGWRYSPTANISNEFRLGRFYSKPDFFRTDSPRSEFFTVPLITNVEPLNGTAIFRPQGREVKTDNIQNTTSWLFGNHSFRFGAQYQKVRIFAYNDAGNLPVYALGLSTAGPTINFPTLQAPGVPIPAGVQATANSLGALLAGVIGSGSQTFNAPDQSSGYVAGATRATPFSYKMFAPYIVDSWKLAPTFTLTAGLRWDYQMPLEITSGAHFEPVIAAGRNPKDAVLDPAGTYQFVGGNAGRKNAFYKPDKNNWAPSIGFAWAPKDITNGFLKAIAGENFVLRGGFRRSFVNDELVTAPNNALVGNQGFQTGIAALRAGSTALDDRAGQAHVSTITTPVFASSRTYRDNNTAAFTSFGTVFAVDPGLQTPNQNDYQVGIQRQFGDWVFEGRYVGGYSKNMLRTIDYNQITLPSAFIADFSVVRANVLAGCATFTTCAPAATAPFINSMVNNGNITATNILGTAIRQGEIAELANLLLINGIIPNTNTVPVPAGNMRALFLPNPNTGVANVLENGGSYYYNAGQFEMRRRFKDGLYLQGNYTFSKELTDAVGTGQTRVEPFLDNNNRNLDYARADYDQTHVFNVNAIYELPVGKGKRWLNSNSLVDYILGGWQVGLVWRVASGSPVTFTDARGTLNRAGRSGRQTALTSLSEKELGRLLGVFKTPCGVFYINPTAININQGNLAAGNCTALTTGVPTGTLAGRGASGFGTVAFPGQVFFNNGPLQTSGLRRAVVNGPWYSSADISLLKNFRITERVNFQVRGEAYNFMNTPYFNPGQFIDVNSTSFGRITGVSVASRVVQVAGRLSF